MRKKLRYEEKKWNERKQWDVIIMAWRKMKTKGKNKMRKRNMERS